MEANNYGITRPVSIATTDIGGIVFSQSRPGFVIYKVTHNKKDNEAKKICDLQYNLSFALMAIKQNLHYNYGEYSLIKSCLEKRK